MEEVHYYETSVEWTGERKGVLTAPGLPEFEKVEMKIYKLSLFLWLLLGTIYCSKKSTTGDEQHQGKHEHAASGGVSTTWNKPEKKFIPDARLKIRMEKILEIMKAMHAAETEPAMKQDISKTGKKIESTVQDIFKNCKLAPDADAAIHPILSELLKGASLFSKGEKEAGHEIIHNALLRYEDFFAHPGWNHKD